MSRLELKTQTKFLKWISEQPDCWAVKYPGGIYGKNGTPDVIIAVRGVFLAIELKAPGKTPTKLQMETMRQIRSAGSRSEWADSLEDAVAIVERVRKEVGDAVLVQ